MPYPFAHPAAILPLARPMGRFAAPSALAIGSMVPDFWYLAPGLARDHSHSLAGLFWFCLPAGLLAYLVFQRLLKQPLVALLPEAAAARLAPLAASTMPQASAAAVVICLLVGAATHLAWDALTHERFVVHGFQVLQHLSTLLGSSVLAVWLWRWLQRAPAQPLPPGFVLPLSVRAGVLAILIALSFGWALAGMHTAMPRDLYELRDVLRSGGAAAAQALALSSIGYAMLFKLLR